MYNMPYGLVVKMTLFWSKVEEIVTNSSECVLALPFNCLLKGGPRPILVHQAGGNMI